MKSLFLNIKNSLPYLIIIVIYFLFVNMEANKNLKNSNFIDNELIQSSLEKADNQYRSKRIPIPVIPYNE